MSRKDGVSMAWISVDQKLIGGKLRKLYKAIGCSQSEAIGILVTLWLWGIDNADEAGLIVSADRSDIADVIRAGISPGLDPDKVVESLVETGWVDAEEDRLFLHDWESWRKYYAKYMKEKKGNAERQARYKQRKRAEENGENNVNGNKESNVTAQKEPEESKPKEEKKPDKYGEDFEAFWKQYPRKVDKGQAFKKYQARRRDGYTPEELLEAAENYRRQCERQRTEPQYIKHAKTFLSDSLPFTDYIKRKVEPQREPESMTPGANPFRRNGG